MTLAVTPFTDLDALHAAFAAEQAMLTAERAELSRLSGALAVERAEKERVIEQNDRLRQIIRQLQRMQFGKRSETVDPGQFTLALEEIEQAVATAEAEQEKREPAVKSERTRQRGQARSSLPGHLPRIELVVEPEDMACPCCGGAMHVIGEDRSERLDVIPAQYQVVVTRRPKYACRSCEGAVVQAPAPARLIEGGLPTEQLVADVVVRKYADHCPLYRQAQILERQGIEIDRATLAFWVGYASAELKPLWQHIREVLLGSARLFVDETRAPVLDPGRGRTKTGYFWTLARDDRPWGGQDPPAVLYCYAPGRGAEHAVALLKGFTGVLQTDGYAAYRGLTSPNREGGAVSLAHCWAHVRRKFYDIAQGGPSPIAAEALKRIAVLYQIETEIRGQSAEARRASGRIGPSRRSRR
jgi:transposase